MIEGNTLLKDISPSNDLTRELLLKYRKEYDMKLDIKKDFDIPTNEHKN